MVPTAAIQRSPQGTFVYLVKAGSDRHGAPGAASAPAKEMNSAIDEGLAPGDRVVVEGAERLREGIKVELKGPGAPTPAKPATPAKAKQ